MSVKGYKVFNPDWTCRGFQYEVGRIYKKDVEPKICNRGFHFCEKMANCFNYYSFDSKNKVAEVLALGEVVTKGDKSCTNEIQIVREIPWAEVLEIVNMGESCSGYYNNGNHNSGNYNSGNWNSGNHNSGHRNSGHSNSGHSNSGNCNSGNCNSGDWNSGNHNSGNHNSGHDNSGDWNKCNFSNGCFNTTEPKIYLFNKPSEWTYRDWLLSTAHKILIYMPKDELEYILWDNMNDEEKKEHPEAEITGGYLKKLDTSECVVTWWRGLSENDKNVIMSIPNFDKDIFKEITGIDVEED